MFAVLPSLDLRASFFMPCKWHPEVSVLLSNHILLNGGCQLRGLNEDRMWCPHLVLNREAIDVVGRRSVAGFPSVVHLCSTVVVSYSDFNRPTPAFFLLIFVLFKHNFFRKNCKHQQESNSDRRIEGEHADHLATTTTAHYAIVFEDKISSAKNFLKFHFNIHFLIWIPSRLSLPSE